MELYKDFSKCIQEFFSEYLVKERNVSINTIKAYRDVFMTYIEFLDSQKKINVEKIAFDTFTRESIIDYLNWLESNKSNSISTRNQRLAAIKSFCKYMIFIDPVHMSQWVAISSIKKKKMTKKVPDYLSVEAVKAIIEQVDSTTKQGIRDLAILTVLYNTAARVQELINLSPSSIRREKPYGIILHGKGNKKRLVPINDDVKELLDKYLNAFMLDTPGKTDSPLFFNSWGEKLTNPGISYIINKYASFARSLYPNIIPENIRPHRFRHSRAMHLLQAGVDLIYIRDFLGHVSIQTTEIYARADSKAKREAIEKAYVSVNLGNNREQDWIKQPKLLEFLNSLK